MSLGYCIDGQSTEIKATVNEWDKGAGDLKQLSLSSWQELRRIW